MKTTEQNVKYFDENDNIIEEVMYTLTEEDASTLSISKGNNKIGKTIYSFSTLPGNEEHLLRLKKAGNKLLTNIPGTCSKHCEGCFDGGCYAVRDAKLHHNVVIKAWGKNTLLLRNGKVWGLIKEFLNTKNKDPKNPKVKLFRINVSGEIQNKDELDHWAEIAREHPEINFGIYTKNYEALGEYFDDCYERAKIDASTDHPKNFIINVSEWHGVAKEFIDKYSKKYPNTFNVFEYDDSRLEGSPLTDEEKEALHMVTRCPAVTEEGRHAYNAEGKPIQCDRCGRCYGLRGLGLRTRVPAH